MAVSGRVGPALAICVLWHSQALAFDSAIEGLSAATLRQLAFGAMVALLFCGAVIVWIHAALQRMRRKQRTRTAFVNSALNNMRQGIIMVSADERLVFCNDHYLSMYRLTRADIEPRMELRTLHAIRKARGSYIGDPARIGMKEDGLDRIVRDYPDGRAILVIRHQLPNGGWVTTHEDITDQRAMAKQLATTKHFLETVIDNIALCVAVKDLRDGRYILANRAFEEYSRFPRDRILGSRAAEIFSPASARAIDEADQAAIDSPTGHSTMEITVEFGARQRTLSAQRVVTRDERGEPEFLVNLFHDVTDRNALARELEDTKKFLELIVDHIPSMIFVRSIKDGRYRLVNRGGEKFFRKDRAEMIGRTVEEVHAPHNADVIKRRDMAALARGGEVLEEDYASRGEKGLRYFAGRRVVVPDEAGEPEYLIVTGEDMTERRQAEMRLAHMAYHDSLTDLPNRVAFVQMLEQMIDACAGSSEFAVLSIDLDRFKEVNDVFGHAVGDRLLVEAARRIAGAAQGASVARLSGDEFGLIVDGDQPATALALAARLTEAMRAEFQIDDRILRIGMTCGIAVFPRHGEDAGSLLANADAALFRAKSVARGSARMFSAETDRQVRDRRALHHDLANALRNGELCLHFQPQAEAGGAVIGFEALARWNHPVRGAVAPGTFIPLAEDSGLIVEMGEWFLREACREAASWARPLQISVNLSPVQFLHGDLVALVHQILLETGLTPGRLELEITEGVLIGDFERSVALLRRLKSLGVRVAMDDFGSGYSSLSYLQAFPFDKIKIDRAFVMKLGVNPQSAAIIRAVIGLGHGLDMPIVAEGVETAEQLAFLRAENCDQVQGYFIGRPAPIATYSDLIGRPAQAPAAPLPELTAARLAG
jgi:diguanylate cyclase (GGDEF)-like protein/PAS domain S-box-containing protein